MTRFDNQFQIYKQRSTTLQEIAGGRLEFDNRNRMDNETTDAVR